MPPVSKPTRQRRKHFLREWRIHRGYTAERAAEMVGMSRENLGKIESGKVPYNQDSIELLAEAYNCEIADLLMRDPTERDSIWTIWDQAKKAQRTTIVAVAKAVLSSETGEGPHVLVEELENELSSPTPAPSQRKRVSRRRS